MECAVVRVRVWVGECRVGGEMVLPDQAAATLSNGEERGRGLGYGSSSGIVWL